MNTTQCAGRILALVEGVSQRIWFQSYGDSTMRLVTPKELDIVCMCTIGYPV